MFRTAKAVPSYIGQGNHLFTTSELARYATALATSGKVYDLSLLDKVNDSQGKTLKEYGSSVEIRCVNIPDNVWNDIHEGMRRVVLTHEQFNGLGVTLSGKTGTAELDIRHPNHGLLLDIRHLLIRSIRLQCELPMDTASVMHV